jgi:hypothetical protein
LPRIAEFYGIVIGRFYNDHEPPHFHAAYGEHRAVMRIETQEVLRGALPNRALNLTREWATLHQEELMPNWQRARDHAPLNQIQPLD